MAVPFTIVGLGKVLWDLFPDGPRFGGAPANFACHVAMLGGDCSVVSHVGDDELGQGALTALKRHGVDTRYVGLSRDHATGTVRVELDEAGRPRFEISEDVAWDHIRWSDELDALAHRADAVCFGTLAQRSETSRDTIRRLLKSTGSSCLRILDVNLRRPYFDERVVLDSLRLTDAVKLEALHRSRAGERVFRGVIAAAPGSSSGPADSRNRASIEPDADRLDVDLDVSAPFDPN
jgi:fructokinase